MNINELFRFGALYKLADEDRLAICHQIAESCEEAFRRGFMHGYMGVGDVEVDVENWRFNVPHNESPSPHGTYDCDAITRHAFAAGLPTNVIQPER